jgi:hypothetical protein
MPILGISYTATKARVKGVMVEKSQKKEIAPAILEEYEACCGNAAWTTTNSLGKSALSKTAQLAPGVAVRFDPAPPIG